MSRQRSSPQTSTETQLNHLREMVERMQESFWYQMLHSILQTPKQTQTLSKSASLGLKDSTMEESRLTSTRSHMIKAEASLWYLRKLGTQALHTQLMPVLSLKEKLTLSRLDQRTQSDTVSTQSLSLSRLLNCQTHQMLLLLLWWIVTLGSPG